MPHCVQGHAAPAPQSRLRAPLLLPPGTAVARILFLSVPWPEHSAFLAAGVFGISPPPSEARSPWPRFHPVPCCLVPATPPHLTPVQLQPAGGKGLPSEGGRPPPSPWWGPLTTVKCKHQEMGVDVQVCSLGIVSSLLPRIFPDTTHSSPVLCLILLPWVLYLSLLVGSLPSYSARGES